jgi:hypothetical protein
MTKNFIILKLENLIFLYKKIAIFLTLGRPSYRISFQASKKNIQHIKTQNFGIFGSFFASWIRIQIQSAKINADPDPELTLIYCLKNAGKRTKPNSSTSKVRCRIRPDPDTPNR